MHFSSQPRNVKTPLIQNKSKNVMSMPEDHNFEMSTASCSNPSPPMSPNKFAFPSSKANDFTEVVSLNPTSPMGSPNVRGR